MKKIIKLNESDLLKIIDKVISEQGLGRRIPSNFGQDIISQVKSNDQNITLIQKKLKDLRYNLGKSGPNGDGVDGEYGRLTRLAVQDFQRKNGLIPIDGIVGPNTARVLGVDPLSKEQIKILKTGGVLKGTAQTKTSNTSDQMKKTKNSGFILIWAYPEYEPKIDGQSKFAQIFGSVVRNTIGGGGTEGTYGKLGHGGCVIIKPNGESIMYEFGRYPGHKEGWGKVLKKQLGRIATIRNGNLLNAKQVAKKARSVSFPPGPNMNMTVAVLKLPNPQGAITMADVKDRDYQSVDFIIGGAANCGTFSRDVADAGGISVDYFCWPTPIAVVKSFKDEAIDYFEV